MDPDWFAALYRTHYRRLVLAAYAFTRDLGEAEEIAQEAFAIGFARRARVSRADRPEAWLCTVAINLARRRHRRRAMLDRLLRRHEPETTAPPADERSEHAELHAAIESLSFEHRAVVVLHYLADLPIDEVAALLDIAVGTVKSRLSRARGALAARLATPSEVDHA